MNVHPDYLLYLKTTLVRMQILKCLEQAKIEVLKLRLTINLLICLHFNSNYLILSINNVRVSVISSNSLYSNLILILFKNTVKQRFISKGEKIKLCGRIKENTKFFCHPSKLNNLACSFQPDKYEPTSALKEDINFET